MKHPAKKLRSATSPSSGSTVQLPLDWNVQSSERKFASSPQPKAATDPRKQRLSVLAEQYLREKKVPYVSVDEAKRALFGGTKLRSFHFVVYRVKERNWLLFAAALRRESLEDLKKWQEIFGPGFLVVVAAQTRDGRLRFRTLAGESIKLE